MIDGFCADDAIIVPTADLNLVFPRSGSGFELRS
jgi:hypothetical protein